MDAGDELLRLPIHTQVRAAMSKKKSTIETITVW